MKNTIKENIGLIVALVATICSIFMFYLGWDMGEKSYAIRDNTIYSEEDLTSSYQNGYNDALTEAEEASMASHAEIVESWLCNLQDVTINDEVVHIVDGNGEEWVITCE